MTKYEILEMHDFGGGGLIFSEKKITGLEMCVFLKWLNFSELKYAKLELRNED